MAAGVCGYWRDHMIWLQGHDESYLNSTGDETKEKKEKAKEKGKSPVMSRSRGRRIIGRMVDLRIWLGGVAECCMTEKRCIERRAGTAILPRELCVLPNESPHVTSTKTDVMGKEPHLPQ